MCVMCDHISVLRELKPRIFSAATNKFEGTSGAEMANIANQTAYNVSKLLDNLLQEYDNSLRPDFGGENTGVVAML